VISCFSVTLSYGKGDYNPPFPYDLDALTEEAYPMIDPTFSMGECAAWVLPEVSYVPR